MIQILQTILVTFLSYKLSSILYPLVFITLSWFSFYKKNNVFKFLQFLFFWIFCYFAIGEIYSSSSLITYDYLFEYFKFTYNPLFNDLLIIIYYSYYFIIPLYIFKNPSSYYLNISWISFISYLIYIVVPISGPTYLNNEEFYYLYNLYDYITTNRNNFLDAMPSVHSALSFSIFLHEKNNFRYLLLLIPVSCYFLQFHYLEDIVVGISISLTLYYALSKSNTKVGDSKLES